MRFDVKRLRLRCEQSIEEIIRDASALGEVSRLDSEDGPLVWVKRGAPVLGCVHLDFVPVAHKWGYDRRRERVYTARLDDRMGVFILLDVLPAMGINLDLLLSDSEEIGRTTAKRYCDWLTSAGGPAAVPYNWLAQFDRRGDDVVTYNYDRSDEWDKALKAGGFKRGHGSFSDIAALYDLGACGVNIGVGYHGEHTVGCYGDLGETAKNLALFRQFYSVNHAKAFAYTEAMRDKYKSAGYTYWQGSFYGGRESAAGYVTPSRSVVRYYGETSRRASGPIADCDEVCSHCGGSVHWLDMGDDFCKECEWLLALTRDVGDGYDDLRAELLAIEDDRKRKAAADEAAMWSEYMGRID